MTSTDDPPSRASAPQDHVDVLREQWQHERPELDTDALAVSARVLRLARFLSQGAARNLKTFGVNEGELNVLAALRRSGPPYRLTPTALYRSLLLSSGAMTNRIDRLEERGLVRRVPDDDDRRRTLVQLTDDGRDLAAKAVEVHAEAADRRLAVLSATEREQLSDLLRTVLLTIEQESE